MEVPPPAPPRAARKTVAVLTTKSASSGNACLAQRLAAFLSSRGDDEAPRSHTNSRNACLSYSDKYAGDADHHDGPSTGCPLQCQVLSHADFETAQGFQDHCARAHIGAVLGIHAFRSGRLLIGSAVPYVIILGGTDTTIFLRDAHAVKVMAQALAGAKELVCFARWMAQAMEAATGPLPCPVTIIPQSVPVVRPRETFEPPIRIRSKAFALVAGLRPVKDIEYLVPVVETWHRLDKEVQLIVIGDARDDEYAARITDRLARSRAFSLQPALPQDELFAFVQQCRAVVNSSQHEGMSGALLEAMALRVPVIARNIPGNKAIITHKETGLLYNTPDEFVACARELISNDALVHRMTEAAANYIQECHAVDKEREAYRALAARLLSHREPAVGAV